MSEMKPRRWLPPRVLFDPRVAYPASSIPPTNAPGRGRRGGRGRGAGRVLQFFTANIKTGEVKTYYPSTDNLNHDQCSPTDPTLVLFCHEGTWELVDRVRREVE